MVTGSVNPLCSTRSGRVIGAVITAAALLSGCAGTVHASACGHSSTDEAAEIATAMVGNAAA